MLDAEFSQETVQHETESNTAEQNSTDTAIRSEETFDQERAMRTIRHLREQEQRLQKEIKSLLNEKKAKEDAELSEIERVKNRAQEAERQLQELQNALKQKTLRVSVVEHAIKLNIVDPDAAFKLIDHESISFDERGEAVGVEDALKELVKTKPYLVRDMSASSANPARQSVTSEDQIRAMVYGISSSPFDTETAKQKGGGVVWKK